MNLKEFQNKLNTNKEEVSISISLIEPFATKNTTANRRLKKRVFVKKYNGYAIINPFYKSIIRIL